MQASGEACWTRHNSTWHVKKFNLHTVCVRCGLRGGCGRYVRSSSCRGRPTMPEAPIYRRQSQHVTRELSKLAEQLLHQAGH
ncbi:hypothetical protein HaLaN_01770 [Haematococcus lacustris]|uniref:Uncharacterized protein n=1 Tax=Haematococcus lacustris TaxID=44745 RepID=A0A699YLW1_HAELA|nr:hypothetical protein HaLaN_01770 [Haematococcus lacustris]